MIDDALKATRTLHRLIITVSLLTIVFALSVELPRDKAFQLEQLEELVQIPFVDYNQFVDAKVGAFISELTSDRITALNQNLEGPLVFSLDEISESISVPVHVGKIRTSQSILSEVQNATISGFDALASALSITQDVQIWLPQIENIQDDIQEFLDAHPKAGSRISNVRIEPTVDYFGEIADPIETFWDTGETWGQLYFELIPAGGPIGAPVFIKEMPLEAYEVPNSSWKKWLSSQSDISHLIEIAKGGDVKWLPQVKKRPDGFDQEVIGLLISNLKKELRDSSPEAQKMTILGSDVPGILVVYASPLVLLALFYYLLNHIRHLIKISEHDISGFRDFAWMPLSFGRFWQIECIASMLILPVTALVLLNFRLNVFQTTPTLASAFTWLVILTISLLSGGIISAIEQLRLKLVHAAKEHTAKPKFPWDL